MLTFWGKKYKRNKFFNLYHSLPINNNNHGVPIFLKIGVLFFSRRREPEFYILLKNKTRLKGLEAKNQKD